MRITGGRLSGRKLQMPKGPRIRSTQDQVRQALFNMLGERVVGARMLDLYCGTGAVGIEALSRGAAHVTFVDRSGFSAAATERNLKNLTSVPGTEKAFGTRYRVLRGDAFSEIRRLAGKGEKFDLIFVDPPYGKELATKSLNALGAYAIVSPAGWVVLEMDRRDPYPLAVPGTASGGREAHGAASQLSLQRIERYGDTALAIYSGQ